MYVCLFCVTTERKQRLLQVLVVSSCLKQNQRYITILFLASTYTPTRNNVLEMQTQYWYMYIHLLLEFTHWPTYPRRESWQCLGNTAGMFTSTVTVYLYGPQACKCIVDFKLLVLWYGAYSVRCCNLVVFWCVGTSISLSAFSYNDWLQ